MTARQLDLFSEGAGSAEHCSPRAVTRQEALVPADLDDAALIEAIPDAGIANAPERAAEAGRHGLAAAVPALERLCRRFVGFGSDRTIPEQVAAVDRLATYRERAVARAQGEVLEIGMGSGLNLPFYGDDVRQVLGLEPSLPLVHLARQEARKCRFPLEVLIGSAEALPLPDSSVDTAVTTWSLCTIPDPLTALREVQRVLRPDGELIFIEHGLAPEPSVARWQDRLTPLWCRYAGGCHLNRPIDTLVRQAGFVIMNLEKGYMGVPRFATFMYEGTARPA